MTIKIETIEHGPVCYHCRHARLPSEVLRCYRPALLLESQTRVWPELRAPRGNRCVDERDWHTAVDRCCREGRFFQPQTRWQALTRPIVRWWRRARV